MQWSVYALIVVLPVGVVLVDGAPHWYAKTYYWRVINPGYAPVDCIMAFVIK
jgi:hypothetical protein